MATIRRLAAVEGQHRRRFVETDGDVGELRREVRTMAVGLPGTMPEDSALIATELGTNLVRHASRGGYALLRRLPAGMEILAVDTGPGLGRGRGRQRAPLDGSGLSRRMTGLGLGLSSVQRIATELDIYSTFDPSSEPWPHGGANLAPSSPLESGGSPPGTVVLARLLSERPAPSWCRWGGLNVPLGSGRHGPQSPDAPSGDAAAVAGDGSHLAALVVDGIGHGPEAARAAAAAVSAFDGELAKFGGAALDITRFVLSAHQQMRSTRGAVLAVCTIDAAAGDVAFAAVGNVNAQLVMRGRREHLVGRDGTLGTDAPRPRVVLNRAHWGPGATLLLATDGLRSDWGPTAYPGLIGHDPAVVAAVLERDYARQSDDATVLVLEDKRR